MATNELGLGQYNNMFGTPNRGRKYTNAKNLQNVHLLQAIVERMFVDEISGIRQLGPCTGIGVPLTSLIQKNPELQNQLVNELLIALHMAIQHLNPLFMDEDLPLRNPPRCGMQQCQ